MKRKKSNIMIIGSGFTGFIVVLFINIFILSNEVANSLISSLIFGIIIILIAQSINNYFFRTIDLEKHSIFFAGFKIIGGIFVWILVINLLKN